MKAISILLLLGLAVAYCHSINRCSVVRAVRAAGAGNNTAIFVCIAAHVSNYDTSLHNSPSEYGIFQINSYWWCDDNKTVGRKNGCGIPCSKLLDTAIGDDIRCAQRIIKDSDGFAAWEAWKLYCKDRDLSRYVANCKAVQTPTTPSAHLT